MEAWVRNSVVASSFSVEQAHLKRVFNIDEEEEESESDDEQPLSKAVNSNGTMYREST
ncbi:2455_t:CDS:1, partial [Paraglomus brasilianum]